MMQIAMQISNTKPSICPERSIIHRLYLINFYNK
jgi:hypothetical protein